MCVPDKCENVIKFDKRKKRKENGPKIVKADLIDPMQTGCCSAAHFQTEASGLLALFALKSNSQ